MTRAAVLLVVSLLLIVSHTSGFKWYPIGASLTVTLPGNGNATTDAFLQPTDDSEDGLRWNIDWDSLESCNIPGFTVIPMEGILSSSYLEPITFSVDPQAFAQVSDYQCEIFALLSFDQSTRQKFYLDIDVVSDWCTYHPSYFCNQGTCNNGTHNCDCKADFYGPTCSIYCTNSTCSNHGTCAADGTCICSENYYGEQCETFCQSATTCSGHGYCSMPLGQCDCEANYFGLNCSTFCNATTMCGGHGSCDFFGTGCNCTNTHWGTHCENECACSEHGHCNATGHCVCDAHFHGETCTIECDSKINCNGNGYCSDAGTCTCNPGYAGASCDMDLIIVGICIGLAGLLVIALGIWGIVRCARKNRGYQQIQ